MSSWAGSAAPSKPPGFGGSSKKQPPGFQRRVANAQYAQPRNFADRNNKLLGSLMESLGGGKSLEFSRFKSISGDFRSGKIQPSEYYDRCRELMDSDQKFFKVFPELIALLPDQVNAQLRG